MQNRGSIWAIWLFAAIVSSGMAVYCLLSRRGGLPEGLPVLLLGVAFGAIFLPGIAGHDEDPDIRETRACGGCGYCLSGLTRDEAGAVLCPECGATVRAARCAQGPASAGSYPPP